MEAAAPASARLQLQPPAAPPPDGPVSPLRLRVLTERPLGDEANPTPQLVPPPTHAVAGTIGEKHVLVMVGLPARGKTHMAKRLERYLAFFHGATTRVFNVGDYRRRASASASAAAAAAAAPAEAPAGLDASGGPGPGPGADADAVPAAGPSGLHLLSSRPPSAGASAFFDQLDSASNATRLGFAQLAMADMKAFLFPQGEEPRPPGGGPGPGRGSGSSAAGWSAGAPVEPSPLSGLRAVDSGRVAIFDATNSTRLAGLPVKLLYIESMCTDESIVEANIWNSKVGLPDFVGLTPADAFRDFKARIRHYEAVYEPMDEEDLSWIKLINCGKRVEINNIHGFLLGRIVQFLANMHNTVHSIYLSRHGQSEYNRVGKIGGDSPLSALGETYAHALADYVGGRVCRDKGGGLVRARLWTSSLRRTIQTTKYISHPRLLHPDGSEWVQCAPRAMRNLDEIYAGVCDGMTYAEIEATFPEEFARRREDKLGYRYPRGESYLDVISRLDPLVHELESYAEPVMVVGHQAVLRLIYAYFTGRDRETCPRIAFPLHTVVKLTPRTHHCDEERMQWDPASGVWSEIDPASPGRGMATGETGEPPSH